MPQYLSPLAPEKPDWKVFSNSDIEYIYYESDDLVEFGLRGDNGKIRYLFKFPRSNLKRVLFLKDYERAFYFAGDATSNQ